MERKRTLRLLVEKVPDNYSQHLFLSVFIVLPTFCIIIPDSIKNCWNRFKKSVVYLCRKEWKYHFVKYLLKSVKSPQWDISLNYLVITLELVIFKAKNIFKSCKSWPQLSTCEEKILFKEWASVFENEMCETSVIFKTHDYYITVFLWVLNRRFLLYWWNFTKWHDFKQLVHIEFYERVRETGPNAVDFEINTTD